MLFVFPLLQFGADTMSPDQLSALIDKYGQTVLRTAYLYLKDQSRAEDISQEVFLKLYKANRTFDSAEHEKAFVLRVTINMCKDQLKSFWSKRIVLDDTKEPAPSGDIAEVVAEADARKRLFQLVTDLPQPFRSVIILYYYEGMNTREISDTLGIPDATVRSRLKRARERLSRSLMKGGADE